MRVKQREVKKGGAEGTCVGSRGKDELPFAELLKVEAFMKAGSRVAELTDFALSDVVDDRQCPH